MLQNSTPCQTKDYGFDFDSIWTEKFGTSASSIERPEELVDTSSKAEPNDIASPNNNLSIEEMAKDLKEAFGSGSIDETDDEGFTLPELMQKMQKPLTVSEDAPIRKTQGIMRDLEEQLSIERILDQVLQEAQLAVSREIIWGATLDSKIWRPLQTDAQVSSFLHGLGIRRYGNSVRWFASRILGDPTFHVSGFFESANLWAKVAFADGLLDVRSNFFAERTLDDRVTAVLRYSYASIESLPHYERLEEAMRSIAGTDATYLRLQEICGVALHAEPSGRILYLQHRNPRVASIFTKLLGKAWSENSVSFLGLRDYERSFRTAQVLEHPIVISGKEGETTLRDISTILALVDGDGINTDRKNQDPFDFVGRCSMICAGRTLPSLQNGSMQTLRFYLIRANLTGELPENVSIRELLSYVREFVAWSIEGLRRYITNSGHFTCDDGSDIQREDASIVSFVEELIVDEVNGKIPAAALHEAYINFCAHNNMPPLPKPRLVAYLKEHFCIESKTVRASWFNGGRPSFGYAGIGFSEAYMAEMLEEDDSDSWHQIYEDNDEGDWEDNRDDSWEPHFVECGTLKVK